MSGDLFGGVSPAPLNDEQRIELTDLANSLRKTAKKMMEDADIIDGLLKRKPPRELDENGEPFFKFRTKVSIPKDFFITKRLSKYALDRGFNEVEIKRMADNFVIYYNKDGKKWQDWSRVWQDWVRREAGRKGGGQVTSDRLKSW